MDNPIKDLRQKQMAALENAANEADEFLQEAAEGWKQADVSNMDKIMDRIDHRIDASIQAAAHTPPKSKITLFRPWLIGLAASALLAVVSIFFFNKKVTEDSPQNLYAAFYQPLDAPELIYRGDENPTGNTNEKALKASSSYGAQQYDISIQYYRELLSEFPDDPKYTLFLGLSLMQEERFEEAIALFDSHVPGNTPYDEDIQWYLALAYLHKGNLNTARVMLEKLNKSKESYYTTSAGQILARLPVR